MKNSNYLAALVLSTALIGCEQASEPAAPAAPEPPAPPPLISGVDVDNMDPNVRPGEDFFRYVNGTWLNENPIPEDRSSFDAFAVLRDAAQEERSASGFARSREMPELVVDVVLPR